MPSTTPPLQAPRVRPLWERAELFREPQYQDGTEWDAADRDSDEDDDE